MAGRNSVLPPRPSVSCAYELCMRGAIVRLGPSNLCKAHYAFKFEAEAEEFCDRMGLRTITEKRAWCAEKMRGFGKAWKKR